MEVGVKQLRDHLREWLEAVQRGEEITVTERGKPVARLIPTKGRSTYEQLVAAGIITPARLPKRPNAEYGQVTALGSISDIVIEQRR